MRVLLTEGSGLTSRQVASRLGQLGHQVELLSSTAVCLARFCPAVTRVHPVPPFGAHPLQWLEAAAAVVRTRRPGLLLPTQEQVAVLSAFPERVGAPTLVPPFEALRAVQGKHSAFRTLDALGLPQPPGAVVEDEAGLRQATARLGWPVYVKREVSTASSGVRRVAGTSEVDAVARELTPTTQAPLLVQAQAPGTLLMVQAVADRGRLVAWHANLRTKEGVSGGASEKRSLRPSALEPWLARFVRELVWHGPVAFDVMLDGRALSFIDVNPRLVEPGNALRAGVDLVGLCLELAAGNHPVQPTPSREGVETRQLLLAVLAAAKDTGQRREVLRTVAGAMRSKAVEELTPVREGLRSALPLAAATGAVLVRPGAWRAFAEGSVGAYSLSEAGWAEVLEAARASAR